MSCCVTIHVTDTASIRGLAAGPVNRSGLTVDQDHLFAVGYFLPFTLVSTVITTHWCGLMRHCRDKITHLLLQSAEERLFYLKGKNVIIVIYILLIRNYPIVWKQWFLLLGIKGHTVCFMISENGCNIIVLCKSYPGMTSVVFHKVSSRRKWISSSTAPWLVQHFYLFFVWKPAWQI